MSAEAENVTLVARFRAKNGQDLTVSRLITKYGEAVRAEAGNIFFDIYTDREDSLAFVIIERYRDEAAFQAHLDGEKGKVFNQDLGPLVEGTGSELQFLRIVS
jgi:quinol monooxygenase YgiN